MTDMCFWLTEPVSAMPGHLIVVRDALHLETPEPPFC